MWDCADCSQRLCPYGLAWADSPIGDLDHDGTTSALDSVSATSQLTNGTAYEFWPGTGESADEAHFYSECSGKGTCDRALGECQCFDGYTGHTCQRSQCADDCSGHGVCRTLREIATNRLNRKMISNEGGVKYYSGVQTAFDYTLWDADKAQACICDPGYTGHNCAMRDCPRGDDPITTSTRWSGGAASQYAKMYFEVASSATPTILKFGFTGWDGRTNYAYAKFATTVDAPGAIASGVLPGVTTVAGKITLALRAMPGGQLQKVEVDSTATGGAGACSTGATCRYVIEFKGRPGSQDLMTVESIQGGTISTAMAYVSSQSGNLEEITCSGRGLCDYSAGICECFAGYYGAACENQNALAGASGSSA